MKVGVFKQEVFIWSAPQPPALLGSMLYSTQEACGSVLITSDGLLEYLNTQGNARERLALTLQG